MVQLGIAGAGAGNVMLLSLALYSGWFAGMDHEFVRFFRGLSLGVTALVMILCAPVFF